MLTAIVPLISQSMEACLVGTLGPCAVGRAVSREWKLESEHAQIPQADMVAVFV